MKLISIRLTELFLYATHCSQYLLVTRTSNEGAGALEKAASHQKGGA